MPSTGRLLRVMQLACQVSFVAPWCCRACGICMCDAYGVCEAATGPSSAAERTNATRRLHMLPPLAHWSVDEVAAFVDSLSETGARNTCMSGCKTPGLFNDSAVRFKALGINGTMLHERLQQQVALEATLRSPNTSVDVKGNGSALRAELAFGLISPVEDAVRVALPFFNRLHMAVRAAVENGGQQHPAQGGSAAPAGEGMSGTRTPVRRRALASWTRQ